MRDEKYPTVPAPSATGPEIRPAQKDRPHDRIVLENQSAYRFLAVPSAPKLEMLADLYSKKARASLIALRYSGISLPFYHSPSSLWNSPSRRTVRELCNVASTSSVVGQFI